MVHLPVCQNQACFSCLRTRGPGGQFFGPQSLAAELQATGIQEIVRFSDPGSMALSNLPPSESSRAGRPWPSPLSLSSVAGCGPPATPRSPPPGTFLHIPCALPQAVSLRSSKSLGWQLEQPLLPRVDHLLDVGTGQAADGGKTPLCRPPSPSFSFQMPALAGGALMGLLVFYNSSFRLLASVIAPSKSWCPCAQTPRIPKEPRACTSILLS